MSFSSGAYFGSHSTVSQGRAASAFRLALLVWIGPLSGASTTGRAVPTGPGGAARAARLAGVDRPGVERQHHRPVCPARPRRVVPVETAEQGDEVAGALGPAGEDDQLALGVVEHAEERALPRPPRRLDPAVRPALGPAVGEAGV